MPGTDSWLDQWGRIHRWRDLVVASRDVGRADARGTEGYRDEVFALFQALWHLKDWLKNDPSVPASLAGNVEDWLDVDRLATSLRISADVCNGTKHMKVLTRKPRAGGSRQSSNSAIVGGAGVGAKPSALHTFYIHDVKGKRKIEAVLLADRCIKEWTRYLKAHGLAPP